MTGLLNFALYTDKAARMLIEVALSEAAKIATNKKTAAYLRELSSNEDSMDVRVITRLLKAKTAGKSESDAMVEKLKKKIEDRISKLDKFVAASVYLKKNLKKVQLESNNKVNSYYLFEPHVHAYHCSILV